MMGLMHLEGNGVAKDRRAAFEWMKRAAEYDSVVGMNHLAVMYESGIGTPADEGKAEYWCRRAADRGHAEAACQYGIYQREKGMQRRPCAISGSLRKRKRPWPDVARFVLSLRDRHKRRPGGSAKMAGKSRRAAR